MKYIICELVGFDKTRLSNQLRLTNICRTDLYTYDHGIICANKVYRVCNSNSSYSPHRIAYSIDNVSVLEKKF